VKQLRKLLATSQIGPVTHF